MSQYVLAEEIISRSVASTWDKAKLEWKVSRIYHDSQLTCLCSHYPISEICVLKNKHNGKKVIVGNCCVQKFIGLSSAKLFAAMSRIEKDITKALNPEVIDLAHKNLTISDRERDFYVDTWRIRTKLSPKQKSWRIQINKKILAMYRAPKFNPASG